MLLFLLLPTTSLAGELNFSPDRPGVGDATGVVGAGHAMVEGGVAVAPLAPVFAGTSGLVGRFGVDDGLELRLRAPDLIGGGGGLTVGSVGLGAKVAAAAGDRWSVSAVPEAFYDPSAALVGASVGTNVAASFDQVGVWTHATVTAAGGVGLLVGGGASVAVGEGGIYVNGGHAVAGPSFGGLGGWWAVSPTVQLDTGVDLYVDAGVLSPVVLLGTSFGF